MGCIGKEVRVGEENVLNMKAGIEGEEVLCIREEVMELAGVEG